MTFSNAGEVYAYLDRYLNFERKVQPTAYRLDRMQALKELFGRPDECYRIIHVAGSKGKGSTATMMASIMQKAGGRVGLYTSPHLLSFTERIAINGVPVDDQTLFACATEISDLMEQKTEADFPGGETPTYFELLTMLGFLCFRRAGCTDAVIEVGLGGRLDSTNVVVPAVSIITPIELEHTDLLGTTIPEIAYEKAGIIKPGVPVFTSATRSDALAVFRARATELISPLTILDEVAEITECSIDKQGTSATVRWKHGSTFGLPLKLRTPMIGSVQARNAALAATVASALGYDDETIAQGIATARLRARFEILDGNPVVILDGAHTADSIRACSDDFARLFPEGGVLLFGCAKGKPPRLMAAALRKGFPEVLITKPGSFKESDTAEIEEAFKAEGFRTTRNDDTRMAIHEALKLASIRGVPLLVTGSFYLCAEAATIVDAMMIKGKY
jgi:dihydrofolate synthase/folylpolyglutamate synthase